MGQDTEEREMLAGERVEVRLHGDATWYPGTALDRSRKQWVQLDPDQYPGGEHIADEHEIVEWRPLAS